MSKSFQINAGQSAIVSLNERTIYMKVSDTVNFTVYESNVELKELRLSLDLEDAYKVIVKCLEGSSGPVASKGCLEGSSGPDPIKGCLEGSKGCLEGSKGCLEGEGDNKGEGNYKVTTIVNTNVMKMIFSARVEGFLKMNFDIILREKIMSNDGQLTLSMNRIVQKQTIAIEMLTQRCEYLEETVVEMKKIIDCFPIFMTNIYSPQGNWCDLQTNAQTQMYNISSKEIIMTDHAGNTIWKNIGVIYKPILKHRCIIFCQNKLL